MNAALILIVYFSILLSKERPMLQSNFYLIALSTVPTHCFSTLVAVKKCVQFLVNSHNIQVASCALDLE